MSKVKDSYVEALVSIFSAFNVTRGYVSARYQGVVLNIPLSQLSELEFARLQRHLATALFAADPTIETMANPGHKTNSNRVNLNEDLSIAFHLQILKRSRSLSNNPAGGRLSNILQNLSL